jgi:large repetitive protein
MKKPPFFQSHTKIPTDFMSRWTVIPILLLGMITNSFAQSPGGVTGASVWLKANAGTSTTTDGSTIATWNDQSGNSRTHTQPNGTVYQPLYKDNVFNFNPAVYFDGLDGMQASAFASGTDAVHVFAMSKVKDNGWRSIYGFGRDATHVQWYNAGLANKPSVWLAGNNYPSTALGLNYGVTSYILPKDGSQKTVHWNGTSGNITGSNNYTFNSTLMGVGTDLNNFGNFSENFFGEIAEVIIYKKAGGGTMNPTDIQKIQSYLGIKYGVTLSHNYLDAGGATVYTLGTYNKNVFGIARDNDQGLYQKQSKSYDAEAYVTLSTGAITTSNANNTGTLADKAFEMVGDNGLNKDYGIAYAPSTFTPTTAFYRMARVWQVQETGTVGTVRITVPTGADRLLVSNSATFTPGASTQELTLTPDGNGGQYADVDLNNTTNKFFTFGKSVGAPGCVAGGLNLWLKADFGTSTTTDGQDVLGWEDASGNGNDHTKLSTSGLATSPEFKTNSGFNFNPSIYFDGGYNTLGVPKFATGNDTLVVFAVSRADNTTQWGALYSFDRDGTHPQWRFGRPGVWLGANYDPLNGAGDLNLDYGINTFNLKRVAGATNQDIWWNGNKTSYTGNGAYGYNATNFWLGNDVTDNGLASSEIFKGDFMEMAVYKNSAMTDAKIRKIQSYFGIKYGITVAHDYISGTDINVWNRTINTGYNNNIFGMGRDDCQDFNQKQSQSYSDKFVTIGNNTTIAATNAANGSSFAADKSFEIIGDNGLTKDYAVAYAPTTFTPASAFYRMNRIWKVQETGTVGTVRINVPAGTERLLVSSSNTFGAGTQEIAMQADGNGGFYADVNLTNGQFFTFGKAITAQVV